ncbi:MAG: response regulator [Anaerolineales bacterium]|jgi:DNA-binding response OmpR family regulator|nr:response regulator [Anaerolineales bacterium]
MSQPQGPILIVEDIPHILELLEVTLKFKGYEVITARNGDEALNVLLSEKPALILTDILMPRLDGYALAQAVRSNPETSDIPIIFLSATFITPEDKVFAMSLGAVQFLEKPIEASELLLTVAEVLTGEPTGQPKPLADQAFQKGYSDRLQEKLLHKENQIRRAQRLVETVPTEQRPAFEALLAQTKYQRDQIEEELRTLEALLDQHENKTP